MSSQIERLATRRIWRSVGLWITLLSTVSGCLAAGPSPRTSAAPDQRPAIPSATVALATLRTASAPRESLGAVSEAVLVRLIGEDVIRPQGFEVIAVDPAEGTSRLIATIPGPVLPADGWLDIAQGVPLVSRGGYLAIPFARGPDADAEHPAIAVVDLRSPSDEAVLLDRYRHPRWGPTDQLMVERTVDQVVDIVSIATRSVQSIESPRDTTIVAWSTDEGNPFLGTRSETWGFIGADGGFRPMSDLGPVYQRAGRERPTGVDLHTLGMACDSGPVAECMLVESRSLGSPLRVWHREQEPTRLLDHLWAIDGRTLLMLLLEDATEERLSLTLVHATTPETRTTLGSTELPGWTIPGILGISSERKPGHPTSLVLGDVDGGALRFLVGDGTFREAETGWWFAGWADDPQPYDPD